MTFRARFAVALSQSVVASASSLVPGASRLVVVVLPLTVLVLTAAGALIGECRKGPRLVATALHWRVHAADQRR